MTHTGHQIVKPTPRRPTAGARVGENSTSMKDPADGTSRKVPNASLEKTATPSFVNDLGQILPERDTSNVTAPFNSSQNTERYFHQITEPENAPGFITNVLISNNTTDNEDDGYEILDDRKMQSEGGAKNHSHLPKKGRKVEKRTDLERLKKDVGALKLNNVSPQSSVWSDNTDIDVDDLDEVVAAADGSAGHHKRYSRKDNPHAPRSKHRSMKFLSNPQNLDRSAFMSSEVQGMHNASQETLSTTATVAEEFVWVDSHSRLVELQQLPWIHSDLMKVLRRTVEQDASLQAQDTIATDILPRLSYYLQRTLVRLAREAQRLSRPIGVCGKENVLTSLKVVLSPSLAISAVKGCLRSAAMFAMSGETTGQSKSSRRDAIQ